MAGPFCDNFIMTEDGENFEMTQTTKGDPGEGVPTGGTAGQVLKKVSDDDYDTEWADHDAGDVGYDSTETYQSGTVGKTLSDLTRQISDLESTVSTTQIINSASGAIASFADGADGQPIRKLVAQIEPVQDLHGYENPWPAGGRANKLSCADAFSTTIDGITFTSDGNGTYKISGTSTATASYDVTIPQVVMPSSTYLHCMNNEASGNVALGILNDSQQLVAPTLFSQNRIYDATSLLGGATVNGLRLYVGSGTTVNMTLSPMVLETNVATSFIPYSNICPISGWTGAEVTRTGRNLLEKPFVYRPQPATISDCFYIKAGTYTFSFDSIGTATSWRFVLAMFDANGNALSDSKYAPNRNMNFVQSISAWYWGADTTEKSEQFVIVEDCYAGIFFGGTNTSSTMTSTGAQLELGSTATDYVPYTGNQISVNWEDEAGTVYGGTDDIVSGNGSDEWTKLKLLSSFAWQMDGTTGNDKRFGFPYASNPSIVKAINQNNTYISNVLAPNNIGLNSHDFGTFYISNSWIVVHDKSSHFETLEDFKAWLDSEDVYLVYKVATPQSFTTEPVAIDTLYGTNNIWSSTGDTEVTYPADTKLYIDGKIAEAIAALQS